ncbi:MAG: hypothetical protein ACRD0S_08180, partial [Acidimicrobiales bacterium]
MGLKTLLGGGLAATFALPAGLAAALAGASSSRAIGVPSAAAVADIPDALLAAYRGAAASCPGLPGSVLAAIGKVETDHGRSGGATLAPGGDVAPPIVGVALDGAGGTTRVADTDGGRLDGDALVDRAVGPMQFLPATWARWGRDASDDGVADPHNAYDAVATYNHSSAYVSRVLAVAAGYGGSTPALASLSPAAVAAFPNLSLSPAARGDLESGLVDPRLVAMLAAAAGRFPIHVGVLRTGHSQCVGGGDRRSRPGCDISEHWYYRAADIDVVAGQAVSPTNQAARALAQF